METLKNKIHNLPLQKAFVLAVVETMLVVVGVSAITIWGCVSFRHFLLPESNLVYLTIEATYANGQKIEETVLMYLDDEATEMPRLVAEEDDQEVEQEIPLETKYAITKVENSYTALTPKRKLAYMVAGVAMILLPLCYSLVGILLCGYRFYRRKLETPIHMLSEASDNIMEQNLDFHIRYDNEDEMGHLCRSYEEMRRRLYENYKRLWHMLEDQKLLQASVAHDLRNPIAIIEGYTEYLQIHLDNDKMSKEELVKNIGNIDAAVRRLERYTESVRELNHMEEIDIRTETVNVKDYYAKLRADFVMLAEQKGIQLMMPEPELEAGVSDTVKLDIQVVYRILENILQNALRFAKTKVTIFAAVSSDRLCVQVIDDGPGFSEQIIKGDSYFAAKETEDGHMGMGIAICRVLCRKHGGSISLSNQDMGACVKIIIGF